MESIGQALPGGAGAILAVAFAVAIIAVSRYLGSTNKVHKFPKWAPIEIALTAHLVGSGGIGRRLR